MRIFFEGPQGSGKTTLAKLLHEELGRRGIEIPLQRGIPTIDFMKEHSEQANWLQSLEMTTQPGVFDRSPLSITVYDAQPSITGQEVWNQHLPQFMSSVGPDDFLILMETPPEIAFQRQRKETAAALESTEAAIAENVRYIELRERLAAPNLGNIGLHTIIVNTETKDPQGSCQSVIEQLHSFRPDLFVEI